MGIKYTVKRLRPSTRKTTQTIIKKATRVWNDAITAYIVAVAEIVSQHQETGMSYASLFATARTVRAMGKLPPFSPTKDFTVFSKSTQGGYAGEYKNARAGEAIGEKCADIHYGTTSRCVFTFEFDFPTAIYQYLMHEHGDFDPKVAWESIEAGENAFSEFMDSEAQDVLLTRNELFSDLFIQG